jgi:DNA-binding Lrp family transcriptional regulator
MTPEQRVLDLLVENARYTNADLARMTDLTESEVYDAIGELEDDGVIRGYGAVVDWRRADRERVRAEVEIDVTLDRETSYTDVAERLVAFDEVTSLRLVSGDYDFDMEVEAETIREISAFVAEEVAPLPEVDGTVTHLVMESFKEGGTEFDGDEDDDRLSVSP